MSLIIGDNFSYQGQKPLDTRLVTQSLTTLLAIPSYTIYDGIQVYVESEKKYYIYDSNNDVDITLNKWREFTVDSNGISEILKYSKPFTKTVNENETINYSDLSGISAITEIKVNQLLNDIAGIIARVVSVDTANNEVQVRILSKDTIIKQDVVHYGDVLQPEIDKVQTIDYSLMVTTEAIADFSINNLIYGENGTLAKVLSKDETNNTLTVVPITLSVAVKSHDIYLTNEIINPKISSQTMLNFSDFVTSKLITDIENTQLVYDLTGTLAKIDSVDITNNLINVTTISVSTDKSVKIYKYLGTNLDKTPDFKSSINYIDLDTTQLLNEIRVDELIYDESGTLAKIVMIDVPNSQLLVQTLTASGMPYAPILKELIIKEGGHGYTTGNIFEANNTAGIYGIITSVDANGAILSVSSTTNTAVNVSGSGAIIDYDTVIYGAYGKNWVPLSNTSSSVAQIVSETFTYEPGFEYIITNGGSGYKAGDIVNVSGNMVEVTKINAGSVEGVRWSREISPSTVGTGLSLTINSSDNSFIIPADIWNNSKRNSFEITNNDGASVEFNRLDNVNQKCSAGNGSIYKFTFDAINGVIYQEKTEIDSTGIGPFVPYKNYKKDELIINDSVIYICKDDHMADVTLGSDGSHWVEMRKTVTSGNRFVSYKYNFSAITNTNNWQKPAIDYLDGDQSMIVNNKIKAPVDGLYYINIYPAYIFRDAAGNNITIPTNQRLFCAYKLTSNVVDSDSGNSTLLSMWHSNDKEGRSEGHESSVIIRHLKAGEQVELQALWATGFDISGTDGQRCEFGLLSEDRSDNLVAEATLILPSTISSGTYQTVTYENSSNIGIISTNGDITLPEDGSYILSTEDVSSETGGQLGLAEAKVKLKTKPDTESVGMSSYASCTSLQICSIMTTLNGSKGDVFNIRMYRSTQQQNLTRRGTPKIRLFKIKSVDYHIDSHDLHKDSGSELSYEDWVASKLKSGQLTVTTTINIGTSLSNSAVKLASTYKSGETSMFSNNKFIAPVDGFYNISVNNIETSATSTKIVGLKLNDDTDNWNNPVTYTKMSNIRVPGIAHSLWMKKGDYLTLLGSSDTAVTISTTSTASKNSNQVTFTLINTGITSSYDANKPHLWPENTEINLGDGLYGYRATGTITAAANYQHQIILRESTSPYCIVSSGGYWNFRDANKNDIYYLGHYILDSAGTKRFSVINCHKQGSNYQLVMLSISTDTRTNAPYDIWVTYTK